MTQRLDEIHRIIDQPRTSFSCPGAAAPSNAELFFAIELLGGLTEKTEPYPMLANAMRQGPFILSIQLAESMESLLSAARHAVETDPRKMRALEYQPNQIPAKERWKNFLFAFASLTYGAVAVHLDDFYLPSKKGPSVHLHGISVLVIFGAIACASAVLSLTIIDHYDRRDNERYYRALTKIFKTAGWVLFGAAIVLDLGKKFGWLGL